MSCSCGVCVTCLQSPGMIPGCGPPLAQRLQPTVDRLRQRLTTFGLRPYVTWLVWTRWGGAERGEGHESILAQIPILPRPKVVDLTSVSLSAYSAGILPVGSVRIEQISADFSEDVLMGLALPQQAYLDACGAPRLPSGALPPDMLHRTAAESLTPFVRERDAIKQPFEFFYEIVEDRPRVQRKRFRPVSTPFRDAENFQWTVTLERESVDRHRDGSPRNDPDL